MVNRLRRIVGAAGRRSNAEICREMLMAVWWRRQTGAGKSIRVVVAGDDKVVRGRGALAAEAPVRHAQRGSLRF